jgi:hypothetical protein
LTPREPTHDAHWASGGPRRIQERCAHRRFRHHYRGLVVGRRAPHGGCGRKSSAHQTVTGALPFDWGSKAESALRIFGADRALLLIEGVAAAKVAMLGIAYPFRRRRQPTL